MSNRSQANRSRASRSLSNRARSLRLLCGLSLSLLLGNALAGCGRPLPTPQAASAPARPMGFGIKAAGAVSPIRTRIPAAPLTSHPRLWLTPEDLPALRARATATNPYYSDGLRQTAEGAKRQMDEGTIPGQDTGQARGWVRWPTESYAMLFAFMSMVEQDQSVRDDYGRRARQLLMHIIDEAAKGTAEAPYRQANFNINERSFFGESFPLTVDWAYQYFSAADKAKIRDVFLRWVEDNQKATATGEYDHPTPIGLSNDPSLLELSDPRRMRARFAVNNHFTVHERNIGMMAMALDAGDDPEGSLRAKLNQATGAWLYMTDYLLDHDAAGGVWPEGSQYVSNGLGALSQLMLGLETSGNNNPALQGQQALWDNPFWEDFLDYYAHSLSPGKGLSRGWEWLGESHQPAFFGDGERNYSNDMIPVLGPMALHYRHTGNAELFHKARWLLQHYPAGGVSRHIERMRTLGSGQFKHTILHYLVFDPAEAAPADPRLQIDPVFIGGQNRILARTGWTPDASWFTYKLSWMRIDHQHGDGNMFELYRKGEWLTKKWVGYGFTNGGSEFCNTLALENDRGSISGGFQEHNWRTGSQFMYGHSSDGFMESLSQGNDWLYLSGDSTGLYNAARYGINDVRHASRSLIWLKPDTVVVYDRARTGKEQRFKRFWLSLENAPGIAGNLSTATTPKGQQFFIRTLLPQNAAISSDASRPDGDGYDETAQGETFSHRLRVEAPGGPASAEFLHVLKGADAGAAAPPSETVVPLAGAHVGALIEQTAVLFPRDLYAPFGQLRYRVPATTHRHFVSGLRPQTAYGISLSQAGAQIEIGIGSEGGSSISSDAAGLLAFTTAQGSVSPLPAPQRAYKADPPPLSQPSPLPTSNPTATPTETPTASPTANPSATLGPAPTAAPTSAPSAAPVGITSLLVAGYPLSFNPAVREYELSLPANAYTLGLTVTTASPDNRLYINGNPAIAGQLVQASTWNDQLSLAAIAANWSQEEKYLIRIRRIGASPNPSPNPSPVPSPVSTPTPVPPMPVPTASPAPSASPLSGPGLTALTVRGYALAFSPDTLAYRLQIPARLAALDLTAITRSGNRLYVNGNPATSGQLVRASTWKSPVTVTAISQDWRTERKYLIHLIR